jgi:hypothetical protein
MVKRNALRTMIFAFAGLVGMASAHADSLTCNSAIGNESAMCAGARSMCLKDYPGKANLKNPRSSALGLRLAGGEGSGSRDSMQPSHPVGGGNQGNPPPPIRGAGSPVQVPEPSSLAMLGVGMLSLAILALWRLQKKRRATVR